jgi:CHAT domain-containing protein/tetratricopeptide (TPR) repeat protein
MIEQKTRRILASLLPLILPAIVLSFLSGCGSQPVSLEKAKQTTAQFTGGSLAVPPRTIDDVLAKLDTANADTGKIASLRQAAAAGAPATSDAQSLAAFYYDRAVAERSLGLTARALGDFHTAYDWAKRGYGDKVDYADNRSYVLEYAWMEYSFGDANRGLEIFQRMESSSQKPWDRQSYDAALSIIFSWRGELTEAKTYIDRFEDDFAAYQKKGPWAIIQSQRIYSEYYTSLGQFEKADGYYQKALEDAGAVTESRDETIYIRKEYSDMLRISGDALRAEAEARQAFIESLNETGAQSSTTADTINALSDSLADQNRIGEATKLIRKSLEIYKAGGATEDVVMVQQAELSYAELLAAQGDWQHSREIFDRLGRANQASWISQLLQNSSYPIVLIKTGAVDEAIDKAQKLHDAAKSGLGPNHYTTAETGAMLAMALAAKGRKDEALVLFRQTVPVLTSQSRQIVSTGGSAGLQGRRLDLLLESYLSLLAERASAGDQQATVEAFSVADYARGRGLQGAISAAAARAAVGNPELADFARQEQNARQQIAVLYGLLSSAVLGGSSGEELRTRIDELRTARASIMVEIERRFPDYAALIDPKLPSLADAQAALRPNEALVAYFVGDEATYVWALRRGAPLAFAKTPHGAAEMAGSVAALRKALNPDAATLGDIPAFDLASANELYEWVLAPVVAGWQGADTLVVVPHKSLAELPFGLLVEKPATVDASAEPLFSDYAKVSWVIRDEAIATVPSVSSFMSLRRLPAGTGSRQALAAFGDPVFNPEQLATATAAAATAEASTNGQLTVRGRPLKLRAAPKTEGMASAQLAMLPALPDTEAEVRDIAISLKADPATSVFTGVAANVHMVKTMNLADRRVVVFATHGLEAGDLDGLTQPALALSSPAVTHTDDNGLLTMGDIMGLNLNADWVVLSACNTASGEGQGAEAVSGLGRAFFYAGTRAILVSNWPVETTSARLLTTQLFEGQADNPTLGRALALRRSELTLIDGKGFVDDSGRTVFSYAHPIFWAPFTLVGDGGGSAQ